MHITMKLINGEDLEYRSEKSVCIIGRSSKCDVMIAHEAMSRQHCQIEIQEDSNIFVTDMGSTNGVLIDGQKIRPGTRTQFFTYLSLSFGAVANLQINLEDEDMTMTGTRNLNEHHSSGPSAKTKTKTTPMEDPNMSAAPSIVLSKPTLPRIKNEKKIPVKTAFSAKIDGEKTKFWLINILVILILGAIAFQYMQPD